MASYDGDDREIKKDKNTAPNPCQGPEEKKVQEIAPNVCQGNEEDDEIVFLSYRRAGNGGSSGQRSSQGNPNNSNKQKRRLAAQNTSMLTGSVTAAGETMDHPKPASPSTSLAAMTTAAKRMSAQQETPTTKRQKIAYRARRPFRLQTMSCRPRKRPIPPASKSSDEETSDKEISDKKPPSP
ncbi:hypothetical protein VNI00_018492 [Paramarasmius palmivorus]|uniref:Uncharacterized protein n=1 Tax=Paramarasmius palmivorus TaxID=297713 RepID=A0AAW0AWN9_9AGAR